MSIISKIGLIEQPKQYVLSVTKTINFNDYPQIANETFSCISDYASHNQLLFSGCPFVCYHNADLENLRVQIGFPVAKPISGDGNITGYIIPPQKAVSGIFLGPYEETDPLMLEIMQWIAERGLEQKGTIYNYFLNDADRPTSELLTQIVIPVK